MALSLLPHHLPDDDDNDEMDSIPAMLVDETLFIHTLMMEASLPRILPCSSTSTMPHPTSPMEVYTQMPIT
jgi:hypothetical protein